MKVRNTTGRTVLVPGQCFVAPGPDSVTVKDDDAVTFLVEAGALDVTDARGAGKQTRRAITPDEEREDEGRLDENSEPRSDEEREEARDEAREALDADDVLDTDDTKENA